MKINKTAVFTEGQTELIFVREFILKIFEYQNIALKCFNLRYNDQLSETEHQFGPENACNFFQIVNVGNDNKVLTEILKRKEHLMNAGFNSIVGLRDMYSKEYRETVKDHTIQPEINQRFIDGVKQQIKNSCVKFHFAIMETEAWILGVSNIFQKIDIQLTPDFIKNQLDFDIETTDPETTFFHPAKTLSEIFECAGLSPYSKSKQEINQIMGHIEKDDFIQLRDAHKCNSFKTFYESVI